MKIILGMYIQHSLGYIVWNFNSNRLIFLELYKKTKVDVFGNTVYVSLSCTVFEIAVPPDYELQVFVTANNFKSVFRLRY